MPAARARRRETGRNRCVNRRRVIGEDVYPVMRVRMCVCVSVVKRSSHLFFLVVDELSAPAAPAGWSFCWRAAGLVSAN